MFADTSPLTVNLDPLNVRFELAFSRVALSILSIAVITLKFEGVWRSINDGPVLPVGPVGPVGPVLPVGPVAPVDPVLPVGPVGAIGPVDPVGPFLPVGPMLK